MLWKELNMLSEDLVAYIEDKYKSVLIDCHVCVRLDALKWWYLSARKNQCVLVNLVRLAREDPDEKLYMHFLDFCLLLDFPVDKKRDVTKELLMKIQ